MRVSYMRAIRDMLRSVYHRWAWERRAERYPHHVTEDTEETGAIERQRMPERDYRQRGVRRG